MKVRLGEGVGVQAFVDVRGAGVVDDGRPVGELGALVCGGAGGAVGGRLQAQVGLGDEELLADRAAVLAGGGAVEERGDAAHRLEGVDAVGGEPVEAGHHVRAELAHPLQRAVAGHGRFRVDVAPGVAGCPSKPGVDQGQVGAAARVEHGLPLQPGGVAGPGLLGA